VALDRNPEKAPKATTPATKPRGKKARDQTKVKAEERVQRKAQAQAKAQAAKTKAKAQAVPLRRQHKTPSELMRPLLAVLIHGFPDRQFVFVGDGGSGNHALARFAARHRRHVGLVSLFSANASRYDPPPLVVGKRPRHRPRKKGAKRPAPEAVVAATAQRQPLEVSWSGGGRRQVEVVSGTGHWHKSGAGLVEVVGVFVHDLSGTHRDSYFFSTDPARAVGPRDRDGHRSLVAGDHRSREAGVSRLGDDAGSDPAHRLARGAGPVRAVLGGGAVVRRTAGGNDRGGVGELSR